MTKQNFLRNVISIAICLAGTTLFFGCYPRDYEANITSFAFYGMDGEASIDKKKLTVTAKAKETVCLSEIEVGFNLSIAATVEINGIERDSKYESIKVVDNFCNRTVTYYVYAGGKGSGRGYNKWKITITGGKKPCSACDGMLINGVRWAEFNVSAHREFTLKKEDYGAFFQWGRWGDGHEQRSSQNYPTDNNFPESGVVSNLDANGQVAANHAARGKFIKETFSPCNWRTPKDDALWNAGTDTRPAKTVNDPCPTGWRLPTVNELKLLAAAPQANETRNGINGIVFGSGTNTIFLPKVGWRDHNYGSTTDFGTYGYYWSSAGGACMYIMNAGNVFPEHGKWRADGLAVRCVEE